MLRAVLLCLVVTIAFGCGATPLTRGGKFVKMRKADPPPGCTERGVVHSRSSKSVTDYEENARNILRNRAADRGGNYVRIDDIERGYSEVEYVGTAFNCPVR